MIPTPGTIFCGRTNTMASVDDSMISTGDASIAVQTANVGNLLPTSNGSFTSSTGTIPNGYKQSLVNVAHSAGGNGMMPSIGISQQSIPQPVTLNFEHSNGGGFSGMDASLVSQQSQQKIYNGNQNISGLHGLGGHIVGGRSNMQRRPSPYGLKSGDALLVSNMQVVSGLETPEDYSSAVSYVGSSRPLLQHYDGQTHQSRAASLSHQMLPLAGHGYAMTTTDILGCRSLYDSSSVNDQNLNSVVLHPKRKVNNALLTHHASYQAKPDSPLFKPQMFDHLENMNIHTVQAMQEHELLQQQQQQQQQQQHLLQQQVQNNQQQQFQQPNQPYDQLSILQAVQEHLLQKPQQFQQPNQPCEQLAQHQHHLQSHQNPPLSNTGTTRIPSGASRSGGHSLPVHGIKSYNKLLTTPKATQQYQFSEFQSQYEQRNTTRNVSKAAHLLGQSSGSQDSQPLSSQSSQLLKQLPATENKNEFGCISHISQPGAPQQGHWCPQPQEKSQMADNLLNGKQFQEEFHQKRINIQDQAQTSLFSSEGSMPEHASTMQHAAKPEVACGPKKCIAKTDWKNQQRWLLLLLHARNCEAPVGSCQEGNCVRVQQLWLHMKTCEAKECGYPRCFLSKKLVCHYVYCKNKVCPLCIPTKEFIASSRNIASSRKAQNLLNAGMQINGSLDSVNAAGTDRLMGKNDALAIDYSDDAHPYPKRLKSEHSSPSLVPKIDYSDDTHPSPKRLKSEHSSPSLVPKVESCPVTVSCMNSLNVSEETQYQLYQQPDLTTPSKMKAGEVKIKSSMEPGQENLPVQGNTKGDGMKVVHAASPDFGSPSANEVDSHAGQEVVLVGKEQEQIIVEVKQEGNILPANPVITTKPGKLKRKVASLLELFTPQQIREHTFSLKQWVGQRKAKAEKNQAVEHLSNNTCQLCAAGKLTFEPTPIYCTCGARIKRNAMYHTMRSGDTWHYFCIPCYNEARGDTIYVDGSAFPKAKLEKKKNDEETIEAWVECDKCKAWHHQICALFNGRINVEGLAEYTCPDCCIEEIEKGERKPLPHTAILGAKDLRRTILSDHIEQRLASRLKQERQERARQLGKSYDEVPGAEELVVRVVSSVEKKLEVKQRFLEIFPEENYVKEFPYKSKVILLFQKIEGVEVCLFGMHVQEFGSECQFPNQRRVYLSYLDSVKYFRPEIKTVTGEALRTFVYHEILIGYLDYCKKRGFTSCYIWACPPLKGEDYILYCHPEIQKTPKSDKLREWYLAMLRKAEKEDVVVELTNLYDHFFATLDECKAKVTAARVPYFDGDYWPGAAEETVNKLRQEKDGRKQQKKGKTRKVMTKRALKAADQTDLSANLSLDDLVMKKLGETIRPMKEDFIMVHLQHSCSHCCLLMVSGTCWVCSQCKKFKLCEKCYIAEQKLDEWGRHPVNSRDMHDLLPVEINGVPLDTTDKDEILESEFFDSRQAFLGLCQGNHYQYDTLRRAKHSSMMVLYHLHNPSAPAFIGTCIICHQDIEPGQGWRCEMCPDFDVCDACSDRGIDHPHKLTANLSTADHQSHEAQQKHVLQIRSMLDLLAHASHCRSPQCQYPNCRKIKGLFRHGMQCKTRAAGGCLNCKKMWYLLQSHAQACKESACPVPRCKDLKEHLKRSQRQSDSRRRAQVMEMMRQRAAEVLQGATTNLICTSKIQ